MGRRDTLLTRMICLMPVLTLSVTVLFTLNASVTQYLFWLCQIHSTGSQTSEFLYRCPLFSPFEYIAFLVHSFLTKTFYDSPQYVSTWNGCRSVWTSGVWITSLDCHQHGACDRTNKKQNKTNRRGFRRRGMFQYWLWRNASRIVLVVVWLFCCVFVLIVLSLRI